VYSVVVSAFNKAIIEASEKSSQYGDRIDLKVLNERNLRSVNQGNMRLRNDSADLSGLSQ
jgi:hypothetical protein